MKPAPVLFACCLSALTACAPRLIAQERYVGDIAACPGSHLPPSGTLVVQGRHFTLTPGDGATVLAGDVQRDGAFAATYTPRNARPGDASRVDAEPRRGSATPFTLTVTGRIEDEAARGSFVSPACSSPFEFRRIPASLMP